MILGTEAAGPSALDPAIFDANLSALTVAQPETARRLRAASAPVRLERADADDGATTFQWFDAEGRAHWLGRTAMPSIRAQALADAFQDGGENALIRGIGAGDEIRRLLERFAPHQAVFVLEDHPWLAAAALRRIDLARSILSGRLLLFVGEVTWQQLQSFLMDHPGYIEPRRALAWPFWEPADIAAVQDSLRGVHEVVGRGRHEVRTAVTDVLDASRPSRARRSLAVITAATDRSSVRTVRVMESAAHAAGWQTLGIAPDSPAWCHPCGVEGRLAESAPTHCILVNQMPAELPFRLPKAAAIAVIWTRETMLPDPFVDDARAVAGVGVRTAGQREHLDRRGVARERIRVLPPAAQIGLADLSSPQARRIVVIADAPPCEAVDVGLHLPTHARLWRAATEIVTEGADRFVDDDADTILQKAIRRLKLEIAEPSVVEGLVSRVRQRLVPGVVGREWIKALAESGIAFDLFGDGWETVHLPAGCCRGSIPAGSAWRRALGRCGLAIFPATSGYVRDELMDAAAAGLAVAVRKHPTDATEEGLSALLSPVDDVWRFDSRGELIELAKAFLARPGSFVDRASATSAVINQRHTWDRRLASLWSDE